MSARASVLEFSIISAEIKPKSVARRIYRGVGFVLGGKAGAGLLSLAYLIIATRILGPHDYGILMLVHGYVIAVGGIISFPAWQAIVRYGAEADRDGAVHRLSRLLRFTSTVELTAGTAAIVVSMVLAPVVGPRLGWPPETVAFAIPYSFALLGAVRSTPVGYLQLVDRFDLIGLHNMVQPVVRLGGALVVAISGLGLKAFLIVWLLAALAEFAVLWAIGLWMAYKRLGQELLRPESGRPHKENQGIWPFLVASNADTTLSELAGRLSPLIVGWVLGPAMAGLYSVAQRATVIIAQPAQILGTTAYAELARMVAAGQAGRPLRKTLRRVIGIALLAAMPVVLIVAFFPTPLVRILAGPAFAAAGSLMVILVIARAIALIGPPCSSALTAMGFPSLSMTANLFASLVFLPAMVPILYYFGLWGAGLQAVGQAILGSALLAGLVWRESRRR